MDFWGCFFAFLAALSSAFAVSKAGLIAKETKTAVGEIKNLVEDGRNSLTIDARSVRQKFVVELKSVADAILGELAKAAKERAQAKEETVVVSKTLAELAAAVSPQPPQAS